MKYINITIIFLLWMALTLVLVFSLVGIILVVKDDYNNRPSTWMQIGLDLKNRLIKD